MRGLLSFLVWILRRGPIGLLVTAAAVFGLGYWMQTQDDAREAEKALALASGPPAAVDLNDYDPAQHMGPRDEVVLRAQPVFDYAYRLTMEGDSSDTHAFMVPLVSPDAQVENKVMGVALYTSASFDFDDITQDLLLKDVEGFGAVGPIVLYNGAHSDLGMFDDLTAEAFADEGLILRTNVVVVRPYLREREAIFAPNPTNYVLGFGYVAAALAALAVAKLFMKGRSTPPTPAPAMSGFDPLARRSSPLDAPIAPSTAAEPAPTAGVPLWKQRSMDKNSGDMQPSYRAEGDNPLHEEIHAPLAATHAVSDFEAVQTSLRPETQTDRTLGIDGIQSRKPRPGPSYDPITPVKSSFGLRKMLIGVVGAAFVVLLGSILFGLVNEARMNDAARAPDVPTAEERLAEIIVDTAVADADPDRHWTDIDMKPVIEWVTAKGLAALGGDGNAQLTLLLIIGLPLLGLIGLRWFFAIRQSMPRKRLYMKLSD